MKPGIVFFGEDLPRRFYLYLNDCPQADLVLIMGTSLEVCSHEVLDTCTASSIT